MAAGFPHGCACALTTSDSVYGVTKHDSTCVDTARWGCCIRHIEATVPLCDCGVPDTLTSCASLASKYGGTVVGTCPPTN